MNIRNPEDWWAALEESKDDLRAIVSNFHPVSRNDDLADEFRITAPAAEQACIQIRSETKSPLLPEMEFDEACRVRDHGKLTSLLNQTWFGVPESIGARGISGFGVLCDLCSESWVFDAPDPADLGEPSGQVFPDAVPGEE